MKLEIPGLQTRGGMNAREHYIVKARRVKSERLTVAWWLRGLKKPLPPLLVTLTRIAPSAGLDDDNLVSSQKGIRDSFAEWIGVDDKHRDIVHYEYAQERGAWGIRIEARAKP